MAAPATEPGVSSRQRVAGCYMQQPRRLPCTLAGSERASPFPSSPSHPDSHHPFTDSSGWESTGTQCPGPRLGGHSSSWQSWCHWSSQENAVVEDFPFQFDPSQRGTMRTPDITYVRSLWGTAIQHKISREHNRAQEMSSFLGPQCPRHQLVTSFPERHW